MYSHYFGLTEKPFIISPDPRYLYMSELHREALAHLIYGLSSDGCFVLLTGEVGTGKTTVCRCLLEQLPEKTDVAIIVNPKLTVLELLTTICEELGIQLSQEEISIKTCIDRLNSHLLAAHAEGRNTVLIIDEAQNLDTDILEQLRLLTNLETNTQKLLRIVLIGQPELRTILNRPDLSQVNQRITSRYHLAALQPQDVYSYIQHRLKVAGCRSRLFTAGALKYVARRSGGIPRVINIICDRALLGAYVENTDQVDTRIMKQAVREIYPDSDLKHVLSSRRLVVVVALLILCAGLSALYFSPNTARDLDPQSTNPAPAIPRTVDLADKNRQFDVQSDSAQSDASSSPSVSHQKTLQTAETKINVKPIRISARRNKLRQMARPTSSK